MGDVNKTNTKHKGLNIKYRLKCITYSNISAWTTPVLALIKVLIHVMGSIAYTMHQNNHIHHQE